MNSIYVLPILETPRLILRPMTEKDLQMVVYWRNAAHVASMSVELRYQSLSLDHQVKWFEETRRDRIDYIVELKSDGKSIGSCGLKKISYPGFEPCMEKNRYIGDVSELRKGYASEIAKRWVQFAFVERNLQTLIARTHVTNVATIKINRRLGFSFLPWPDHLKSDSEDWVFMRMTRDEWQLS